MKLVSAEINELGYASRIFKNERLASESGLPYIQMSRKDAVSQIRQQVFVRSKGECEWCSTFLSYETGHLHEMIHRGRGGEISLVNCVFICYSCHFGPAGHGDRNVRFGEYT